MKKYKYSFAPDAQSGNGVFATVAGAVSLALFLVVCILSLLRGGDANAAVGAIGLFGFLFSVYAFIVGIRSLREKKVNHRFCIVGSIASGIMSVIWLALFFGGIK